jgi:hypothetical protein
MQSCLQAALLNDPYVMMYLLLLVDLMNVVVPTLASPPGQALINRWASLWPFLPPALVVNVPLAPASSAAPSSSDSGHSNSSQSAQIAATLHAAQTALLPPTSPLHLAEWELGLLGLSEEQQGCFHAGCTRSMPPGAAAALADAIKDTSQSSSGGEASTHSKPLQLCSGCRLVRYCGRECQMAAWRAVHKHTCKLYVAAQKRDACGSVQTDHLGSVPDSSKA